MQNLGQSGLKNYVFLHIACSKFVPKSIHQIARLQFQNKKFSSFPTLHPPVHAGAQLVLTRH